MQVIRYDLKGHLTQKADLLNVVASHAFDVLQIDKLRARG